MKIIFQNTLQNNKNFYDLCEKNFDTLMKCFNEEAFDLHTGSVVLHFTNRRVRVIDKITRKKLGEELT